MSIFHFVGDDCLKLFPHRLWDLFVGCHFSDFCKKISPRTLPKAIPRRQASKRWMPPGSVIRSETTLAPPGFHSALFFLNCIDLEWIWAPFWFQSGIIIQFLHVVPWHQLSNGCFMMLVSFLVIYMCFVRACFVYLLLFVCCVIVIEQSRNQHQ